MKTVKAKNALRAVLTAWALFMDLNLRSGNNYVNLGESLTGTSGAVALAAMAGFLALEWADEKLTRSSGRVKLAALMMGAWQAAAVSVSNTDSLNQPFLSGSQTLKAVVLALGMAMLSSAITVYFRDLEHILGIVTMVWMYMTPIFYSIDMIPEKLRFVYHINPMSSVISCYRDVLYYSQVPDLTSLAEAVVLGALFLGLGMLVFGRLKKGFAEEL